MMFGKIVVAIGMFLVIASVTAKIGSVLGSLMFGGILLIIFGTIIDHKEENS